MKVKVLLMILIILFCLFYVSNKNVKQSIKEKYMSTEIPPKTFYSIINNECIARPQKDYPLDLTITPGFNIDGRVNPIIFYSEEKCNKYRTRCENLNNEKSCTDKKWCGWCTGPEGNGKCILGAPTGPMNLFMNKCSPYSPDGKNAYYYGYHDPPYIPAAHNPEHVYPNKLM